MIQSIIEKWESNKNELEDRFRLYNRDSELSYAKIVELIFETIINTNDNDLDNDCDNYDISKMTVIDDGDYQGTQIFIIPKNTYQPSIEDYLVTNTYYGSCSGCDTLEAILSDYDWENESKYFRDSQVTDLMTLSLHLVQKLKFLSGE